jgi:predicted permease
MSWWRVIGRDRMEAELDAELRDHVERLIAEHVAAGMSAPEARRRARLEFGGMDPVKEACRDARGTRWLGDLGQDVKYGVRMLRRSPGFTAVAVLSLALGIGANTAIFSMVDAVLLKPLPVRDPARLVLLGERAGSRESLSHAVPTFVALGRSSTLEGLCAFRPWTVRVMTSAGPEALNGQLVSGKCFSVIGIRSIAGRIIGDADDRPGAAPVAVISYAFWQRQFGSDPGVLGRSLEVQGRPVTIVGVTPREFFGFEPGRAIDISFPLSLQPVLMPGSPLLKSPRARWLRLIGRLRPGTSPEAANADLDRIWRQAQVDAGSKTVDGRLQVSSGAQGLNDLRREYSLPLRLLTLAVAVLLLLACANLGSLLLARARAREHEIGLRLALGASRGRTVRQLLTELILLFAAGGAAGLAFAYWGTGLIVSLLSRGRTPIVLELTPDPRLMAFATVVSLTTGLILGVIPAIRAIREDPQRQLQDGARSATRSDRTRHAALVGIQAAFSIVLVSGAALFGRSLMELHHVDVGFDKERVLLVSGPSRALYGDLIARFQSLPTVQSVTLLMDAPLPQGGGLSWTSGFSLPGRPPEAEPLQASFNFVGPRFFETMGIPLFEGRDFRAADDVRAPAAAIVNQALARRYFPGRSALGERMQIGKTLVEIVGIAKDVRYRSIREEAPDMIYRPYLQQPDGYGMTFAIRADMPVAALGDLVRREVRAAAPALPAPSLTTLDAVYDASITTDRLLATLSGFFGAMALLLVSMGVYGTISYAIAQRRRELGVRIALGADGQAIRRLLVKGALVPVAAGVLLGLPAALMAGTLGRSALFGITPRDPLAYGVCTFVLFGIAALAAWMPARRAAHMDPVTALRAE